METVATSTDARRRPGVALVLSLISAGLGQVYCGRIAKGLVLMLLSGALGPIFAVLMLVGPSASAQILLVAFVAFSAVWLYAVVDAYRLAKRAKPDYQLKDYNRWYVYLLLVLLYVPTAVGYALLVREGFVEAFRVATDSMSPTLRKGDRVLANKRAYRTEPLRQADVVVFINPNQRHMRFIKRVIALPGDTFQMRSGEVYVNGQKLQRSKAAEESSASHDGSAGRVFWEQNGSARYRILLAPPHLEDLPLVEDVPETRIPPGHCYVLGDNRNNSRDSRHFGPVPLVDVIGRIELVYFPRWSRVNR